MQMDEMIQDFVERVNEKSFITPILPTYPIICTIKTFNQVDVKLQFAKEGISIVEANVNGDVLIAGEEENITDLLKGVIPLSDPNIKFKGTYRHFLLLESIFVMAKHKSTNINIVS
ncbi:hypothetical protein ACWE42_04360 [Sutcliffiella cohnii]|uniref:SCP2 domain-containing protein n=1 Tax=Sutcliffiella cohnii TaxID=33932 RepID=A0A223KUL8_9BACI|nr:MULTISPECIES: hypothetical protein [Sutcliffiella]AST93166.1 hypothetical protein BC6307_18815 [Sutcliffiella cohnii]MED4016655.1 hypothetical protein [Sutcliffiella cohnii]WBL14369.1 hypothetical protein O1A01_21205 [Sutcliffiella sp. NC1]